MGVENKEELSGEKDSGPIDRSSSRVIIRDSDKGTNYEEVPGQNLQKRVSAEKTQAPRMQLEINGRNITYFGETKHVEFQTRDMVDIRCQIPGGWDLVKTFAFMENFIKASKDF